MKKQIRNRGALFCAALTVILFSLAMFAGCRNNGETKDNEPKRSVEGAEVQELWTMEDYTGELGTFEGLDAETEWRILQDHLDTLIEHLPHFPSFTVNDLRIVNYYGTYNEYVVVAIEDGIPVALPRILPSPFHLAGIEFPWLYPSHPFPQVWNNGQFYTIQELYLSDLFTQNDLKNIARYDNPKGD